MLKHVFSQLSQKSMPGRIVDRKKCVLLLSLSFFYHLAIGQSVTTINIDFSASKDTSVTIKNKSRSGDTCGGTNCIVFKVTLNPGSDRLSFDVLGAPSFGALTYQVNCGTPTSIATPVCITGLTTASVTFCKSGNNQYDYVITTSSTVKGSADLTLRQNCSGTMSVTGLQASSVIWTSVYPGAAGQYNNYLSPASGATSTVVTPQAGSPDYIDYRVYGSTTSCGTTRGDTIRVYTKPVLTAPITPANPAICSGASATLTASPAGGNPPYSYSWNTGSSASSITVNTIGTYTLTVSDNTTGCSPITSTATVTAAPTPAAPSVAGVTICAGQTATLTATAPGGTYQWYTAATGGTLLYTGNNYTTGALTTATDYYVQTTVSGCPSSRTRVTVTVNSVPAAPTAAAATTCSGNTATLTATAPGGSYQWYAIASGGTPAGSGNPFTTPALSSSTSYFVETTVAGCTSTRSQVVITVNSIPATPTAAPASICSGASTTLTATAPGGNYQWYTVASGGTAVGSGNTYTTPILTSNTSYFVETTIAGCTSARFSVQVTVNPIPAVPSVTAVTICSGNTAGLAVNSPIAGYTYQWYDAASAGNLLTSANSYTTNLLTSNANYYVQSLVGGCNSSRATATVSITNLPAAPTAASVFICSGNQALLTATAPGGSYQWYDAASGGNFLGSGNTFNTGVLTATTQFYVQTILSGCTGPRSAVTVTVNSLPAAPTVLGTTICAGNNTSLTATAPGGIYQWYDAASGGNLLFTGPTFLTSQLSGTITYYVQSTVVGCTGNRSAVTVSVLPAPLAPTVSDVTVCAGSNAILPATAPGGTYQWYDAATGGNLLFTGSVYITPPLNSKSTFYVQASSATCTGPRASVTVTVNPVPAAPVSPGGTICAGNPVTLTVTTGGGSFRWYDSSAAGNLLTTGSSYTTPVLTKNSTYYVETTVAGCTSMRAAVTASVIPVVQPAFTYPSGTFCISGTNPKPVIAGSTGVFSASPAGLVFSNTATGEINLLASALGVYTIQFTVNGLCTYNSSARITITNAPNASFVYNGPYCPQQLIAAPSFANGSSAGVFSSPSSGIVFMNNSTGEIDLKKSTPGTYTIQNTIAAAGGCVAAASANTVTINTPPTVKAGANQTICAGGFAVLNGAIGGTATKASWSGGAGIFSDTTQLSSQYKPGSGEAAVTLYLTTDDPAGPCTAAVDSLMIFINPKPTAPVVNATAICTGNTATLVAVLPGGSYEWFDTANAGTLLASGNIFTTPVLTVTTTYYIQTTLAGCASSRMPVSVTVAEKPAIQSAASGEVCSASVFTYLIRGNQPGSRYTWTRAAVAGISNPSLTGITDSTIMEVLNNTTTGTVPVTYSIQPSNKGCFGELFFYTVSIKPTPAAPVINNNTPVCAGSPLNLGTATISGAAYQWSGPNGFSSTLQNPVLSNINTSAAGIYTLLVTVNNCTSSASSKNIAPVIAAPAANSNSPVCEQTTLQLTAGGLPGATYSWSGPAGFRSVLQNPSIGSIKNIQAGTYYVTASVGGCTGLTDSVTVVVNIPPPQPSVTSNSPVCSTDSILLRTSNTTAGSSFRWSGPNGFKSVSASPLIPNAAKTNEGVYNVTVSLPGCAATNASSLSVLVNQKPAISSLLSNSPLCEGDTLRLRAGSLPGASFSWQSVAGFRSSVQNPVLGPASKNQEGSYFVIASINGCVSDTAFTKVSVITAAVANAGSVNSVCANNPSVKLSGSIRGEDTQTGTWLTNGSGSFLPEATRLTPVYFPSPADTARGRVTLILKTTGNRVCAVSTDSIQLLINPAPVVNAGLDYFVCANDSLIQLQGSVLHAGGGVWSTSGTGFFRSGSSSLNPTFVPSRRDIQKGSAQFYLVSTGNGNCIAVTDTVTYTIQPTPTVDAGNDFTIFENETLQLSPTVQGSDLRYLWTPAQNLSSDVVKNPILTGKTNQLYTLRVTGTGNCSVQGQVFARVLKPFVIPNVFSPNGDGIYDTWVIPELANYPGATVEIFTRSGMKIFGSYGYEKPWDGTYQGKPVPVATYYYIIRPNFRNLLFSGSVTIIR